jgi:N6-adenosine-specific RNA methylase IME4
MDELIAAQPTLPTLGEFSETSWTAPPAMTYEEWESVGVTLQTIQGAVNWWVGDWLNEGETRYGETYAQAIEATGKSYDMVAKCKWVSSKVKSCNRLQGLSWTHHEAVAGLDSGDQERWLDHAEQYDLSVADLKKDIRDSARVIPPPLDGQYRVIYADPPWAYDNSGFDQSAEAHYPTMTIDEIAALPVGEIAALPSVLYLWATVPLLPDALEVMNAWGFEYKTHRIWKKDKAPGIGWWGRTYHELLLIGAKGDNLHPAERLPSVVEAPADRHSAKPDTFAWDIENNYEGPYIELFARIPREGWAAWGNEDVGP